MLDECKPSLAVLNDRTLHQQNKDPYYSHRALKYTSLYSNINQDHRTENTKNSTK